MNLAPVTRQQPSATKSLAAYLAGLVVLIVLVAVLTCQILGVVGVTMTAVLADLRSLHQNHQREDELDRKLMFHRQRIARKDAIAEELLRGRCSLQQAVECFHELTVSDPLFRERVQAQFPEASPEESFFRHVAGYALLHGSRLPNIQSIRNRLQGELELRFEARGTRQRS